jgi:hypothetical protein
MRIIDCRLGRAMAGARGFTNREGCMSKEVGFTGLAMLVVSCATSGALRPDVRGAQRAYEREHRQECAVREEAKRRRDAERAADRSIVYGTERGQAHAPSTRLKGEADAVGKALAPLRDRLRGCDVGDVGDEGLWQASFSVNEKTFTSHDPKTAACVSSAVGTALADAGLVNASRVDIVIRPSDLGLAGLSKPEIKAVLDTQSERIRACYEAALGGWPDLEGTLRVKFIIAPDGHVLMSALSDSTLKHDKVACCVLNVVDDTHFPPVPNKGIVVVTYPWIFKLKR